MATTRAIADAAEKVIGEACARNAPSELHYEGADGEIIVCRARLLELTRRHILADRPLYVDDDDKIPPEQSITVHVAVNGVRYQFDSMIEDADRMVRLNNRQHVPGIALRKPLVITDSQRRAHLRVSLAGYDPINVNMVRPDPVVRDACPIDAELISGWMVDVSVGGVSVLVDHRVVPTTQNREQFYSTFTLPGVAEEFCMLGSVRHVRVVEASDSLRVAFSFRPWNGRNFKSDERRLSRFVADHERRLLRRRR